LRRHEETKRVWLTSMFSISLYRGLRSWKGEPHRFWQCPSAGPPCPSSVLTPTWPSWLAGVSSSADLFFWTWPDSASQDRNEETLERKPERVQRARERNEKEKKISLKLFLLHWRRQKREETDEKAAKFAFLLSLHIRTGHYINFVNSPARPPWTAKNSSVSVLQSRGLWHFLFTSAALLLCCSAGKPKTEQTLAETLNLIGLLIPKPLFHRRTKPTPLLKMYAFKLGI